MSHFYNIKHGKWCVNKCGNVSRDLWNDPLISYENMKRLGLSSCVCGGNYLCSVATIVHTSA